VFRGVYKNIWLTKFHWWSFLRQKNSTVEGVLNSIFKNLQLVLDKLKWASSISEKKSTSCKATGLSETLIVTTLSINVVGGSNGSQSSLLSIDCTSSLVPSCWNSSLQCDIAREGVLQSSLKKSKLVRPLLDGSMSEKPKKCFRSGACHSGISGFFTIDIWAPSLVCTTQLLAVKSLL